MKLQVTAIWNEAYYSQWRLTMFEADRLLGLRDVKKWKRVRSHNTVTCHCCGNTVNSRKETWVCHIKWYEKLRTSTYRMCNYCFNTKLNLK